MFFLHITSGPDNANNLLALAFGGADCTVSRRGIAGHNDEFEREHDGAYAADEFAYIISPLTVTDFARRCVGRVAGACRLGRDVGQVCFAGCWGLPVALMTPPLPAIIIAMCGGTDLDRVDLGFGPTIWRDKRGEAGARATSNLPSIAATIAGPCRSVFQPLALPRRNCKSTKTMWNPTVVLRYSPPFRSRAGATRQARSDLHQPKNRRQVEGTDVATEATGGTSY